MMHIHTDNVVKYRHSCLLLHLFGSKSVVRFSVSDTVHLSVGSPPDELRSELLPLSVLIVHRLNVLMRNRKAAGVIPEDSDDQWNKHLIQHHRDHIY